MDSNESTHINEQAEISVIGSIILRPQCIHTFELDATEFGLPAARAFYQAMVALIFDRGQPVDVVTVADELGRQGRKVENAEATLADWAARVPTAENVRHYARIVRRLAQQRRLIAELGQLQHEAGTADPAQIVAFGNEVQKRLARTCDVKASTERASAASGEVMADVEADRAPIPRIKTGIEELDSIIGGIPVGCLTVLAARPTQGKSTLSRRMAVKQAQAGRRPGYLSFEEDRRQFTGALLCSIGLVDTWRFLNAPLKPAEKHRLHEAKRQLDELPIFCCYDRPLSTDQAVSRLRQMKAEHGIDIAYVDYWNRIVLPGRRDRTDETADVVSVFAAAAADLGIALVVCAQLNRQNESEGRRPCLRDLKESGSWEESAFDVLFVHRPAVYKASEPADVAEVIVAKQKMGPTGTARLRWCGKYLWIDDAPPPGCVETQCVPSKCQHNPSQAQGDLFAAR